MPPLTIPRHAHAAAWELTRRSGTRLALALAEDRAEKERDEQHDDTMRRNWSVTRKGTGTMARSTDVKVGQRIGIIGNDSSRHDGAVGTGQGPPSHASASAAHLHLRHSVCSSYSHPFHIQPRTNQHQRRHSNMQLRTNHSVAGVSAFASNSASRASSTFTSSTSNPSSSSIPPSSSPIGGEDPSSSSDLRSASAPESSSKAPNSTSTPLPASPVFDFPLSPIPSYNPLGEQGRCIRSAGAIVIGDEILNGKTLEKNSHHFARWCFERGVDVKRIEVVPDDEEKIIEAATRMVREYDLVITTGGIGPTHDDITYASLARAFDLPLRHHQETLRRLDEMTAHRSWAKMQNEEQREATRRMALFPWDPEVDSQEESKGLEKEAEAGAEGSSTTSATANAYAPSGSGHADGDVNPATSFLFDAADVTPTPSSISATADATSAFYSSLSDASTSSSIANESTSVSSSSTSSSNPSPPTSQIDSAEGLPAPNPHLPTVKSKSPKPETEMLKATQLLESMREAEEEAEDELRESGSGMSVKTGALAHTHARDSVKLKTKLKSSHVARTNTEEDEDEETRKVLERRVHEEKKKIKREMRLEKVKEKTELLMRDQWRLPGFARLVAESARAEYFARLHRKLLDEEKGEVQGLDIYLPENTETSMERHNSAFTKPMESTNSDLDLEKVIKEEMDVLRSELRAKEKQVGALRERQLREHKVPKAEVLFVGRDIWVPVVRLHGRLCIFPGIPSLFQRMLLGLERYLPLPPPDERRRRVQVFTERPESTIAPYLTSLQARLKAHARDGAGGNGGGIRVGSYPVLGRGVFVSLIGRESQLAGAALSSSSNAEAEQSRMASITQPGLHSNSSSNRHPNSNPWTASSDPESDSEPKSVFETIAESISDPESDKKHDGKPSPMTLDEIAREVEREIGGRILSEEEVREVKNGRRGISW